MTKTFTNWHRLWESRISDLLAMAMTMFDSEKVNGSNDFGLWHIKMKAMLVQQGLVEANKGEDEFKKTVPAEKQDEMREKAHSPIILCLSDKVLREVAKEKTTAGIWTKLELLYMVKSFTTRLYAKQRLYSFKIDEGKGVIINWMNSTSCSMTLRISMLRSMMKTRPSSCSTHSQNPSNT